mgnify:FL=1
MTKKILTVITVLLSISIILVGCSGKEKKQAETAQENTVTETEAKNETKEDKGTGADMKELSEEVEKKVIENIHTEAKEYSLKEKPNVDNVEEEVAQALNKDYEKGQKYQELYKNLVDNKKLLNIEDIYKLEREYDNGLGFDFKHPYNLALAIDVVIKYNDETLKKNLFAREEDITDISAYFKKDGEIIPYKIAVDTNEDCLSYVNNEGKIFLKIYFVNKSDVYLIDKIEKSQLPTT